MLLKGGRRRRSVTLQYDSIQPRYYINSYCIIAMRDLISTEMCTQTFQSNKKNKKKTETKIALSTRSNSFQKKLAPILDDNSPPPLVPFEHDKLTTRNENPMNPSSNPSIHHQINRSNNQAIIPNKPNHDQPGWRHVPGTDFCHAFTFTMILALLNTSKAASVLGCIPRLGWYGLRTDIFIIVYYSTFRSRIV